MKKAIIDFLGLIVLGLMCIMVFFPGILLGNIMDVFQKKKGGDSQSA